MAIAVDTTLGVQTGTASSVTYAYTCSGSDRLLVVFCMNNTASDYITGITYNSVALTKIATSVQTGTTRYGSMWYLAGPATGSNNIVITFSASTYYEAYTASYTGVDSTPLDGTANTQTATSVTTLTTTAITTTVDGAWLVSGGAYGGGGGGSLSAGANTSTRVINFSVGIMDSGAGRSTGSNSLVINYLAAAQNAGFVNAAFKPVAASGPTNLKSLNTNVKANIKSYNTNVIANVKSINTNA